LVISGTQGVSVVKTSFSAVGSEAESSKHFSFPAARNGRELGITEKAGYKKIQAPLQTPSGEMPGLVSVRESVVLLLRPLRFPLRSFALIFVDRAFPLLSGAFQMKRAETSGGAGASAFPREYTP
jgi:hypothetical protein